MSVAASDGVALLPRLLSQENGRRSADADLSNDFISGNRIATGPRGRGTGTILLPPIRFENFFYARLKKRDLSIRQHPVRTNDLFDRTFRIGGVFRKTNLSLIVLDHSVPHGDR